MKNFGVRNDEVRKKHEVEMLKKKALEEGLAKEQN